MAMPSAWPQRMPRPYTAQPSSSTMVGLRYRISRSRLALM